MSHVPKKPKIAKAAILASSTHNSEDTDDRTGKSEIIAYYNTTKGGVDEIGKNVKFTLDISSVNAHLLHQVHH